MSKYLLFFLFSYILFSIIVNTYAGESFFVFSSMNSVMSTFDADDEGWNDINEVVLNDTLV